MEAGNSSMAEIQRLLSNRPNTWWYVLAARSSMRVLPFVVGFERYRASSSEGKAHTYLATFRAAQVSWTAHRFPAFDPTSASAIARNGNRIVGRTASSLGAAGVARAAYSVMDAAGALAQDSVDLAKRALQGSHETAVAALPSAGESFLAQIFDDVAKLTEFTRSRQPEVLLLAAQRLWRGGIPRWARESERQLSFHLTDKEWDFWLGWYQARLKGASEFNLSNAASERLNRQIAEGGEEWWSQDHGTVNRQISELLAQAQVTDDNQKKTISQIALDFINSSAETVSIPDLVDEFSRQSFPVIQKTLRGELSRLASSGQIDRISAGRYRSIDSVPPLELSNIPEVERQTKGAIQFEAPANGLIAVRAKGSVGKLLSDDSSRRRHSEVLRYANQILIENTRTDQGGNVSVGILKDVQNLKESLGSSIEELDPDLLVPRGDGLRRDLAAYERRDDFSNLPPLPDILLLDLGKLVAAYNNYISYDPELAVRDEALLGPDARKRLVPPAAGQEVVKLAVEIEVAAPDVLYVLDEEAKVAPPIPDMESRQSRRYSEGAKNFARIAVGKAIDYARTTLKVGAAAGAVTASGLQAAKWVLANETWLLNYFSENYTMLSIIEKLVEFLRHLPLS